MTFAIALPQTNLKLYAGIKTEYFDPVYDGTTGQNLGWYGRNGTPYRYYYNGTTNSLAYTTNGTLPTTNINMGIFRGATRSPFFRLNVGTYTLNDNSIIGQPGGAYAWTTGDVLKGYSGYGYEAGGGGVQIGSKVPVGTNTDPNFGQEYINPFDVSKYTYLRQVLWNTTKNTFLIRLTWNSASVGGLAPPADEFYNPFIFIGTTGLSFTAPYGTIITYTENVSGDYSRVWFWPNGPTDFGTGGFRLVLPQGPSLN
jgi:hypothetical protein